MADKVAVGLSGGGVRPLPSGDRLVDEAGVPVKVEISGAGAVSFSYFTVTLGLTNAACTVAATNDENLYMPKAGKVLAVSAQLNASITAGTITVKPGINGSDMGVTANVELNSTTQRAYVVPATPISFTAGQRLTLRITTDASVSPETTDLLATVWYRFD